MGVLFFSPNYLTKLKNTYSLFTEFTDSKYVKCTFSNPLLSKFRKIFVLDLLKVYTFQFLKKFSTSFRSYKLDLDVLTTSNVVMAVNTLIYLKEQGCWKCVYFPLKCYAYVLHFNECLVTREKKKSLRNNFSKVF